ncbi:MAG: hypothetical protein ACM3SR_05285 [Ignavibacteriales bacterium]
MNITQELYSQLNRVQKYSLIIGALSLALCVVGAFFNREQFFRSYLLAYVFWIGIALGCFAVLMMYYLVGGLWGVVIRRLLESGTRTLPLMVLLFMPIAFGLSDLYIWARPEAVARDELLQQKSGYLNVPFFLIRAVIYFAVWIGIAYFFNKWSLEQDRTAEPSLIRRLRTLSGPGMVLYWLTATFASVDWIMSLEPHWFSSAYGMIIIAGQVLVTLAFVILMSLFLSGYEPLSNAISSARFHDLGNLLLTFLILWAYVAFSQYLITWSGNATDENSWYVHRMKGGWEWVGLSLMIFYFFLPFLLLLSRYVKRRAQALSAIAAVIIFMHLVYDFWLVEPTFHRTGLRIHWMDFVAPIGIGGIWITVFIHGLKGRALLPIRDPRLEEVLEHG